MNQADYLPCIVIPHYNHSEELAEFLPKIASLGLRCVVVDDGSDVTECTQVKSLIKNFDHIELVQHEHNRGKGAAVLTGVYFARSQAMSHVVQIDADGQHDYLDIPRFIDISRENPRAFICGKPLFDSSAPKARLYGRKVTDFWACIETLSFSIKDGLCGFRVYPLLEIEKLIDAEYLGPRMDFDTEILVKAVWNNIELNFVDTKVCYLQQGASHFNYIRDNLQLIKLHSRLMLGMVRRLPWLIAGKLGR